MGQTAYEETYSMRYRPLLTLLMMFAALGAAQDRMAETLRKGVVEEESNHNLNAAVQNYEAVLAQFNDARQTAATALFRMAECYRKQGNGPKATAAYQRVVREFADQSKLAEQSRGVLLATYHITPGKMSETETDAVAADRARQQTKLDEQQAQERAMEAMHRQQYRRTFLEEIDLVNKEIAKAKKNVALGLEEDNVLDQLNEKLIHLQRDLAAFDAGLAAPAKL